MKRLDSAGRLIAVLERRGDALRRQAARERGGLAALDGQIAERRAALAQLRERLAASAPPKPYTRSELMRVRGKQAAIRHEIACRQIEADELLERRQAAEQALRDSLAAALALERRRDAHRDWLARRRIENERLREAVAEADITEGAGHGFNHQH
ncbi:MULTISPECIES: BsaT protein [Burkholderia]|uniref:BsaT protein n=1 Tax=Burkholderia TaxID=32008 RepID=UPI00157A990F|nr:MULTISPECIES: BsaT protein [Burkholderia]MCU9952210.1 BsaT protein [Burkholderia sp. BKH01]NTY40127.1 BsaT protein [Burkholderia diffusa]